MARGCIPRPSCKKRAPPGRLSCGLCGVTPDKAAKGSTGAGVEDAEEEAEVGKVAVGAETGVGLDTISSSPKSSNEGVAAALDFFET